MINLLNTEYGFEYGPVKVTRVTHCDRRGWVILQLTTEKSDIQIYVTRTGRVKIFPHGSGQLPSPKGLGLKP